MIWPLERRVNDLAEIILAADDPLILRAMLLDLAMAADTAELLLRKDFPGEAGSLRKKVADARYILAQAPRIGHTEPVDESSSIRRENV